MPWPNGFQTTHLSMIGARRWEKRSPMLRRSNGTLLLTGGDSTVLKAGTAVDWSLVAREEWHHRWGATGRANDLIHLAARLAELFSSPVYATGWATLRLVEQPFFGIKRLFALREHELATAISALKPFVLLHTCTLSLQSAEPSSCRQLNRPLSSPCPQTFRSSTWRKVWLRCAEDRMSV